MSLRVLVCDDDLLNRRLATRLLGRLGVTPDLAEDGPSALSAMRTGGYDLVLMDIHMPGMTGIEVTRTALAELAPGRRPRVVGLSATAEDGDAEAAVEAGMIACLGKPARPEDLQVLLDETRSLPA